MKLSAKMTEEQDDQQIVSEWRFAAMVNINLVIFQQDFFYKLYACIMVACTGFYLEGVNFKEMK